MSEPKIEPWTEKAAAEIMSVWRGNVMPFNEQSMAKIIAQHAPSSHAAPTPHSKYKDVNWVRGEGPGDAINNLVDRFSAALREKLHASETKYQWRSGWMKTDWANDLRHQIREHLEKGDPRDVAAYCAFAWHHEWGLASPEVTTPSPCCANPNREAQGPCEHTPSLHPFINDSFIGTCLSWVHTHNVCLNCGKEEKL